MTGYINYLDLPLDPRLAVRPVGVDRHLPALPGAGVHPDRLQRDGGQARGHLLAGRDDRVVFPGVVQWRKILAPFNQLVRHAGHGGDDDGHLVPSLDLALDAGGDIADAVEIGDGGAAEFHHDAGHAWVRNRTS